MGGGCDPGFNASTSASAEDPRAWTDDVQSRTSSNLPADAAPMQAAAAAAPTIAPPGRPQPRSRGRPPGSKNKPKPPAVVVARERPGALRHQVVHVLSGTDVAALVVSFARRWRVGVVVLGCSGAVANVALREPPPARDAFALPGLYEVLSLRGYVLPEQHHPSGLMIYLAAGRGQVLGGNVVGPLKASGSMTLEIATFSPLTVATQDWLSPEDEEHPAARATGGGAGEGAQLLQRSGFDAGGAGGSVRWPPSSLDRAAAQMHVYSLPMNHVGTINDQIPDAVLAESWASSSGRPPAPPSDYK